MTDLSGLALACAAGGGVGLAYFAALWATVRAIPQTTNPALLLFASYLLRVGGAGALFLLLAKVGGLWSLMAGLAGFALARTLVVRRVRGGDRPVTGNAP